MVKYKFYNFGMLDAATIYVSLKILLRTKSTGRALWKKGRMGYVTSRKRDRRGEGEIGWPVGLSLGIVGG